MHKRVLAFVLVCGLFFFLCMVNFVAVFEDAFISFRYAQNLTEGHGLVFNPGERVWGYSNFLWTVILAACAKLRLPIILTSKCLGILCAMMVMALLTFRRTGKHGHQNLVLVLSGPLLLSTNTHVLIAAQNGMETLLFTLLAFGGILSLIHVVGHKKAFPLYAVFFLLAALTRPEGPLLMAVAGGAEFLIFLKTRTRAVFRRGCAAALLFGIPYGAYLVSMYAYYGYPLPNAFYVKVHLDAYAPLVAGLSYVMSFLSDIHAYVLLIPIVFGLLDKEDRTENGILLAYILSYLAFVILVGGDFQVYFYRFVIPVLPALFLLIANGLSSLYDRLPVESAGIMISLVFLMLLMTNFLAVRSPVIPFFSSTADRSPLIRDNLSFLFDHPHAFRNMAADWFSEESLDIHPMGMVGQALDKKIDKGKTLATGQCGQIPFYLKCRTIVDMLGLMDNHVAHEGLTIDYLKKRAIDHFILYYNETPSYYFPQTLFPHIILTPYFQNHYFLDHVYRHKTLVSSRGLVSQADMLLFSKREHPANMAAMDKTLKEQVQQRILAGHATELICHINGPERGTVNGSD